MLVPTVRILKLPKTCRDYVGQHGSTRIWVPESGRDEFGRLVLEILDYALNDPPPAKVPAVKEVTIYLDENGEPSNESEAFQVVKTQIRITEKNIAAESGKIDKSIDKAAVMDQKSAKLQDVMDSDLMDKDNLEKWLGEYKGGKGIPDLGIAPRGWTELPPSEATIESLTATLKRAKLQKKAEAKRNDARQADAAAERVESQAPQARVLELPRIDYRLLEQNLNVLGGGR